jgi:hypothetical protein
LRECLASCAFFVNFDSVSDPAARASASGSTARGGLDAWVPQFGQDRRISLAFQDRVYKGQPGRPADIADHVMNLQIHLGQGFVHRLHVLDRHLYQLSAMPLEGSDGADRSLGSKCGTQQSHRQLLQPTDIPASRCAVPEHFSGAEHWSGRA